MGITFKSIILGEHHHDILMMCLSFSMPHWFHCLPFFSPIRTPICLWPFIWRIDCKAAYSAGSLRDRPPQCHRYTPPQGETKPNIHRGFFWGPWHLLMQVSGPGAPALISIGGKSLYSLLASTLPMKARIKAWKMLHCCECVQGSATNFREHVWYLFSKDPGVSYMII